MEEVKIIPVYFGMVKAFLIKGKKTVLVDTGLPGSLEKIKVAMRENSIEPGDISLIVVSHNHTDHVGELYKVKEYTGAKVAVHRSEARDLSQGKTTETNPTGLFGKIIKKFFKSQDFKGIEADILVDNELDLEKFGIRGKLLHTPGHTPGSLTVLLSNGDMIVGDMFSGKINKKEGKAILPIFASDIPELMENLKKIVSLNPRKIYNSHGEPVEAAAVNKLIMSLEKR